MHVLELLYAVQENLKILNLTSLAKLAGVSPVYKLNKSAEILQSMPMNSIFRLPLVLALTLFVLVSGWGILSDLNSDPTPVESSEVVHERTLAQFEQAQQEDGRLLELGAKMPEFELTDFRGRSWNSEEFKNKKAIVVLFLGIECPLVKLYAPRLNEIVESYKDQEVQLIGINSNLQDSMAEMGAFARDTKIEFPLLKDPSNRVADLFKAQRTPEAFVFDGDGALVYRGRIDDQYTYGRQRLEVQKEYVIEALDSILNAKPLAIAETESVGCIIGRSSKVKSDGNAEVTYSEHVSRILQDKCVNCHRPGEIAPFSLLEYDEVAGWADMIQEVVNENRMPPWHADPAHGTFKNDIRLSETEKDLINRWVDGGVAQGDLKLLPEARVFMEGWQIGKPDVEIEMSKKPYRVPATGVVDYEYFVVPTNFKEDRWISAAEIRIGNRSVVHHVIVGLNEDGASPHGGADSEWIVACAPGSPPLRLPEGYAKLIPAGSDLVFQMHYTPNGTAQDDLTRVGFKFVEDPKTIKRIVGTQEVIRQDFQIPAGADNHKVVARKRIRRDAIVLTLFPHMHLRGKAFRYEAKYPDGSTEILLDVPEYDFNWQNSYIFEEPKRLPKGTMVICTAHFDNSKKNIANPDPNEDVFWGDQTDEEMMIGYFDMAYAEQDMTQEK